MTKKCLVGLLAIYFSPALRLFTHSKRQEFLGSDTSQPVVAPLVPILNLKHLRKACSTLAT